MLLFIRTETTRPQPLPATPSNETGPDQLALTSPSQPTKFPSRKTRFQPTISTGFLSDFHNGGAAIPTRISVKLGALTARTEQARSYRGRAAWDYLAKRFRVCTLPVLYWISITSIAQAVLG
ncbi:hypothetical protein L3X38_007584 [Prunus dulcis]|uniref:Uncharacterized protein n=1 Tax=Prunus dulcis TaxID=3755 RepID=A0AAD4ZV02_PRUDU|nr:hypothetical protein L3X38_007584 [Prunus dulcis]